MNLQLLLRDELFVNSINKVYSEVTRGIFDANINFRIKLLVKKERYINIKEQHILAALNLNSDYIRDSQLIYDNPTTEEDLNLINIFKENVDIPEPKKVKSKKTNMEYIKQKSCDYKFSIPLGNFYAPAFLLAYNMGYINGELLLKYKNQISKFMENNDINDFFCILFNTYYDEDMFYKFKRYKYMISRDYYHKYDSESDDEYKEEKKLIINKHDHPILNIESSTLPRYMNHPENAINSYVSTGYVELNEGLRRLHERNEDIKSDNKIYPMYVNMMKFYLMSPVLQQDIILYRAGRPPGYIYREKNVVKYGDYKINSFWSFTLFFGRFFKFGTGNGIIILKVPKGSRIIYTANTDEGEVIIPYNSTITVTEVNEEKFLTKNIDGSKYNYENKTKGYNNIMITNCIYRGLI